MRSAITKTFVALALVAAVVIDVAPASATEGFESGSCLLELEATLTGHTLVVDTIGSGTCVTTEGMGQGALDVSLPGNVGFDCNIGYVVGAATNGNGALTVAVDNDIVLSMSNMLVVGASDGLTLSVAFEGQSGARVVAGNGTFALMDDSSPPCPASSPVTTWTGTIAFGDPTLP